MIHTCNGKQQNPQPIRSIHTEMTSTWDRSYRQPNLHTRICRAGRPGEKHRHDMRNSCDEMLDGRCISGCVAVHVRKVPCNPRDTTNLAALKFSFFAFAVVKPRCGRLVVRRDAAVTATTTFPTSYPFAAQREAHKPKQEQEST